MKIMKKLIASLLVFALLVPFSYKVTYAQLSGVHKEGTSERVQELTLKDVVERGQDSSSMLLLLSTQMVMLENQKRQLQSNLNDTRKDIKDIEDLSDDLRNTARHLLELATKNQNNSLHSMAVELDAEIEDYEARIIELEKEIAQLKVILSQSQRDQILGQRSQILAQIDQLEKQIEAMVDVIKQLEFSFLLLDSGHLKLNYQQAETKLIVEMMLTSSYVQLLMEEEQLDLMSKGIASLDADIIATERQVELGVIAKSSLQSLKRERQSQLESYNEAKDNYERKLAKLLVEIGVVYDPNIQLTAVPTKTLQRVNQTPNIEQLVAKSYAIKRAEQDVLQAELERDNAKNNNISVYEQRQKQLQVDIQKDTLRQQKIDLQQSLVDLYHEADKVYAQITRAKRSLSDAIADYNDLRIRYDVGLISKFDFESAAMSLEQAEFQVKLSELTYYLIHEQVRLAEAGLVQ